MEFFLFAGGAVALVVLAGVVIFLAHRNTAPAGASDGARHGRSRRESRKDSWDYSEHHRRRRRGSGGRKSRRRRYRDEEKDSESSSSSSDD